MWGGLKHRIFELKSICLVKWLMLLAISSIIEASAGEHRVALVIGNADYSGMKSLSNSLNDSADIASKLRGLGFDIVYRENLRLDQAGTVLQEFEDKLTSDSVALVYFAGHGVQVDGENYLPLVDANIRNEHDVRSQSLSLKQLMAPLDRRETRLNLVFLDACRDNPYSYVGQRRGAVPAGLARYEGTRGSLVVYATGPGQVAEDGKGRNGPFSLALLEMIDTPDLEVNVLLTRVTAAVAARTEGKQVPYRSGNLQAEFFFHLATPSISQPSRVVTGNIPPDPDVEFWKEISQSNRPEDYDLYLTVYPQGRYASVAKLRVARLRQSVTNERKPDTINVPEWTTDRALGLLKNLASTKPKGKIGQIEALQFLTSQGYSAAGLDLSGLDLSGASLASLNAEDSQMSMVVLNGADFSRSHLARARMVAARGESVDFSDSDLSGVVAGFGQFSGARFNHANLRNSNWPLADLRNANFREADLTGANFEFADLRDADLSGANLEHAFLGGADLRGAKFAEAKLKNTDVVAAVYAQDSELGQVAHGLCETFPGTRSMDLGATELIPNPAWEGGYEYKKIRNKTLELPKGLAERYESCASRIGSIWDSTSRITPVFKDFKYYKEYLRADGVFKFDHALLQSGGRRAELMQQIIRTEDDINKRFLSYQASKDQLPRRARLLIDQLSKSVNRAELLAPIVVDGDSALLYLLKTSPQEEATINWPLLARVRFDLEAEAHVKKALYPDSWGDFFPKNAYPEDIFLKPVVEAFRQWTLNRVTNTPDEALLTLGIRYEGEKAILNDSSQPTITTKFGFHSASQPSDYMQVLKELGFAHENAKLIPTPMIGHTGIINFDKPLSELYPTGEVKRPDQYGTAAVTLRINKVKLLRGYVIWEATPLAVRLEYPH